MARLTLNGMYQYDPTIFDGMNLPTDYDRDALFAEIMQRCGQMYPYHQVPAILKSNIRLWFARNYLQFDRIMEALNAEYNPVENYDRHENWTRTPNLTDSETRTGTDTVSHTGDDTENHTGTDSVDLGGKDTIALSGTDSVELGGKDSVELGGKDTIALSGTDSVELGGKDTVEDSGTDTTTRSYTNYKETVTESGGKTTEELVSAFDSSSYEPSKKTIETYGDPTSRKSEKAISGSYSDETIYGKTEDTTYGKTEDTTYGKTEDTTYDSKIKQEYNSNEATTYGTTFSESHTGNEQYYNYTHGNIGIRSAQELIEQSLELSKYDVYIDIAERFEREFMVQVY